MPSSSSFFLELDHEILRTNVTPREVLCRLDECACREWSDFLGKCQQEKFIGKCRLEQCAGVGYSSCIWRLNFTSTEQEFKAIIKCPNPKYVAEINLLTKKEELDYFLTRLVQFHNREVHFYSKLVPKLLGDLASEFLPRPFAWKGSDDVKGLEKAFLLLEDLSGRAKPPSEPDNLNKEQVDSILSTMARIHALSLVIVDRQPFPAEDYFYKYPAKKVIQRLCAPENGCGQFFMENKGELEKFTGEVVAKGAGNVCAEFGIRPVLTHGDLWSSNLLFHVENPNKLAAVLDWQFVQPGTGVNDLAHLLLGSVDVELRRTHQAGWMQLYHDEMEKWARKVGQTMPIDNIERMGEIFNRHVPREVYFQMQMLVLNEEAGEAGDKAKRRQLRLVEMFKDLLLIRNGPTGNSP